MYAAGLAVLLSGCGGAPDRPTAARASISAGPTPSPTPSLTPSPTWTPPNDPAGVRACDAIRKINAVNAIKPDLDAMLAVAADGEQSNNPGIVALAKDVRVTATALKRAGAGADLSTTLAVGTAGLTLETACLRGGYIRPGS